jgi:F-type H+-transporting ATPase subunit b
MRAMGSASAMILFGGFFIWFFPDSAIAADPGWRPTYDVAMRWVNFIIIVAVIVKYGREPIKNFLRLQKGDIVAVIDELETEKNRIRGEIAAVNKQGDESQARFQKLQDRLIVQGETRKQQIVELARQQSTIMLEECRRKMENRIVQAKASLKMELLDMAMDQAVKTLPELITEGDSQRLLDDYMHSLHT